MHACTGVTLHRVSQTAGNRRHHGFTALLSGWPDDPGSSCAARVDCWNLRNGSPKGFSEMDWVCQGGRFTYLFNLMSRARMAGDRCALNPGGGEAANALSESVEGDEFPVASGESEDHWFRFASFGLPLRVGKGEVDGDLVNGGLLQRRQHAPSPRTELSRPSTLPH